MIAVPRMRVTPPAITLRHRAEFIPIYTYCISRRNLALLTNGVSL
jgi:hypothetical protein